MAGNSAVTKVQNKKYDNQTLSECIKKMYLESEIADVHFSIESEDGSTERVPAHKSLLAAVSDVFKAMFYGDLKEDGDVKMSDVTAAALKEFLQFFYLGQIELTEENAVEVMHLGHKYNVIRCEDVCVQFLKDTLTNDNIFTAMNIAILYDQNQLMKSCEKQIIVNTNAVFESSSFLECDKRVLGHILEMNLISCSEIKVFEACMAWVKARSKRDDVSKELIQEHLGDLFYQIRFTSMAVDDFLGLSLSHKKLFSSEELENIIRKFAGKGLSELFNSSPRQGVWDEGAEIMCDRKLSAVSQSYIQMLNKMNTKFSSNEPILLGGLVFAKISVFRENVYHDLRSDLPIDVSVIDVSDPNNGKTLSNFKSSLPSKVEKEILLPNPVLIRPGSVYQICIIQSPEGHCYDDNELKSESCLESDITIQFHNDHLNTKTKHIVNMVTALLFNKI